MVRQFSANKTVRSVFEKELQRVRGKIRILGRERHEKFIGKFLLFGRFQFRKARFLCGPEHGEEAARAHRERERRHFRDALAVGAVAASKPEAKRSGRYKAVDGGTSFRTRIRAAHKVDVAQFVPDFFGSVFGNPRQ